MISFNQSAKGQKIRVNFRTDISAATTLTMTLQPRSGDKQELTPTLGTSSVTVGDETFTANEYVEYTTTEDQFEDYTGVWRKKATALIGSVKTAMPYTFFRVTE